MLRILATILINKEVQTQNCRAFFNKLSLGGQFYNDTKKIDYDIHQSAYNSTLGVFNWKTAPFLILAILPFDLWYVLVTCIKSFE